jgi:hypothetical protein
MGRACNAHEREINTEFHKGKNYFRELGIDERLILN